MMKTEIALLAAVLGAGLVRALPAQAGVDTLRLYARRDSVALDPNGFLMNPAWRGEAARSPDIEKRCRFRVVTGNLEERALVTTRGRCLSADERALVTLNEPASTLGLGFVCASNSQIGDVRGHINWFPVTATGQLRWVSFSHGPGEDNDLSFDFSTPQPNAVTSGNPGGFGGRPAYHIELYYFETLSRLDATRSRSRGRRESWWHVLSDSLENNKAMHRLVDGRLALVTGLFGLDGVHDFQAELHPAFAMSVLIDTARTAAGRLRERWAVMVRNRGGEGDCAYGSLPMTVSSAEMQTFVLDLRRWPGAGAPEVTLGASWISDPGRTPRARADAEHLYVAFSYPAPEAGAPAYLFLGTIEIEWAADGAGPALARFADWLPAGGPGLNLRPTAPESVAAGSSRRPRILPGIVGQQALADTMLADSSRPRPIRRLEYAARDRLDSIPEAWQPPQAPRVDQTVALLIPKTVIPVCPPGDPVCRRAARMVVGGSLGPPLYGFAGYQVFAHAMPGVKHIPVAGDFLSGFGYRLEVRKDEFRRDCDTGCVPRAIESPTARLSAIMSPNSLRAGRLGTLATYFIVGGGVSWAKAGPPHFTWGVGVGGQINTPWLSGLFLEFQNYGRVGGFLNHWSVNLGLML
jgi:hypothetical protein